MSQTVLDSLGSALPNSKLSEDEQLYVIAACTGELQELLENVDFDAGKVTTSVSTPPPMYLEGIEVTGFRGIAAGDALKFHPGPGLTLVTGRNGTGKSSYVEALEIALSGDSFRWKTRQHRDWVAGWSNVHHPAGSPIRVRATLARDGASSLVVTRTWSDATADVHASKVALSDGAFAESGLSQAMETTPPILSYSELGKLADARPIDLYRPLYNLLGLERLNTGLTALGAAHGTSDKIAKAWRAETTRLTNDLDGLGDARAVQAHAALTSKPLDLATLEELALETSDPQESLVRTLTSLSTLRAPTAETVETTVRKLTEALQAAAETQTTTAHRAHRWAQVLEAAIAAQPTSEEACIVCGTADVFDADWSTTARANLEQMREEARIARDADRALKAARRAVRQLARPVKLPSLEPVAELDLPDVTAACEELAALEDAEDAALIHDLGAAHALYADALQELVDAAKAHLETRRDRWRPFLARIIQLVNGAEDAKVHGDRARALKRARNWLTTFGKQLRGERFAPIADQATEVWATLRQSSSVQLDTIALEGSGKRGSLALSATVDDTPAPALGVMSQGELNTLGLALFLPRATSPESPFRFVVIDDPVQAMDSHKVDGLAALLRDLSTDRQVVVFTHDPRLPEAIRRMQIAATILEVERVAQSIVRVHTTRDPVEQYLEDAFAACREAERLGTHVAEMLVAGHCRAALEAACTRVIRRRRLGAGVAHSDIEETLRDTHGLHALMTLAMFDAPNRGADVLPRLNRTGSRLADAFQGLKSGAHGDLRTYPHRLDDLIRDTRALSKRVLQWR